MFGEVSWVLAVIVFWAFVFCLVVFLTRMVSRERDDEEVVCELPEEQRDDHHHLATM